jgi:hypothetical protein
VRPHQIDATSCQATTSERSTGESKNGGEARSTSSSGSTRRSEKQLRSRRSVRDPLARLRRLRRTRLVVEQPCCTPRRRADRHPLLLRDALAGPVLMLDPPITLTGSLQAKR